MSDVPAVRDNTNLTNSTVQEAIQLGDVLVATGFLPNAIKTGAQAAAVIVKGQEIGIGPMQSLSSIDVIQGSPTISAELMRALIQRAGHKFRIIENGPEGCTVEGVRRDDPDCPLRMSYTMEDAKRSGDAGKDNYKKRPAAMFLARATTQLGRAMFADVIAGCSYVPEELGVEVDEEGRAAERRPEVEVYPISEIEVAAEEAEEVVVPGDDEDEYTAFEEPPRSAEHEKALGKLKAAYNSIAEDKRPDKRQVWESATESEGRAKKVLSRLWKLAEEYPLEVEEAVPDEADGGRERGSGFIHDEQVEMLLSLAEKLGMDREDLEKELGHDLNALTKDEAKEKIDEMRRRVG